MRGSPRGAPPPDGPEGLDERDIIIPKNLEVDTMCRNKVEGSSGHTQCVPKRELEVNTMCRNEEEEEDDGHSELIQCTETVSTRCSLQCSEASYANVLYNVGKSRSQYNVPKA